MKVYILTEYFGCGDSNDETILGVFTKPNYARKFFDEKFGLETKNEWTKVHEVVRAYHHLDRDSYFYVTEYAVGDK